MFTAVILDDNRSELQSNADKLLTVLLICSMGLRLTGNQRTNLVVDEAERVDFLPSAI